MIDISFQGKLKISDKISIRIFVNKYKIKMTFENTQEYLNKNTLTYIWFNVINGRYNN